MIRVRRTVVIGIIGLAVVTGCSSPSGPTTSSLVEPITTVSSSTTTVAPTTSTTTLPPLTELSAPSYRIVERSPTEGPGDEVVVLLDPATYDSLTDIDLYDVIVEVVELFPPIAIVHVVDSPAAANVVTNPEASDADRAAVTPNYLARLDDGVRVTFLGPFAGNGTTVLGS